MKTIGKKIKAFRLDAGLSQTQLAQKLGISSQAVSKWETNFSQPDITLLPEIASLFGIPIDDLFGYTREKMYAKIEKRLEYGHALSHAEFQQFEDFLLKETEEELSPYEAYSLLGFLYSSYGDQVRKKAVHYGKKALELKPNSKFNINLINQSWGGAIYDWDARNHQDLIEYYQKTLKIAPENKRLYFYLLDNLLEDGRLSEAERTLAESREKNPDVLNDYYAILIDEKRGGFESVKDRYLALVQNHAKDWRVLFSVANALSQNGAYALAIPIWEKAFDAQEKPRYTDYYESIAQCHILLGQKKEAIQAYKKVLQILKEEWQIRFGASVDRINEKIQKLAQS